MQTKKNLALHRCDKRYYHVLSKLTSTCQGIRLETVLRENELLCRKKDNTVDLYAARENIVRELASIRPAIENSRAEIFTAGIHIARIKRGKITPLLGLLAIIRLAEKIPPPTGYAVVNEKAEKLFLYGKDVFQENILKLSQPGCNKNYVIVLNEHNDALGWGRIRKQQNTIYIQNIIDVGWYLRSGV